jgi:hypothetical protein
MEENQDIKARQIFGKLERILLSGDGEIYIVLTKDKIGETMTDFLKSLDSRYKGKDVIVTFHSLERGRKRKGDD